MKILHVEDEKIIRVGVSSFLSRLGYEVEGTGNGKEGIELAKRWHPDLILMDIRMPVMDGIQACRMLKSIPATEHIPIVFVTAYSDASLRQAAFDAGAKDYLNKPVDMEKLSNNIRLGIYDSDN